MSLTHEDYIKVCVLFSKASYCKRNQVGAIMVKNGNIIAHSYNGTISGRDNDCEDADGHTKPEVIHAEQNLVAKAAQSTTSSFGASVYCTLSPCIECAKLLIQAGILEVFYLHEYREIDGINLLKSCDINVTRISLSEC